MIRNEILREPLSVNNSTTLFAVLNLLSTYSRRSFRFQRLVNAANAAKQTVELAPVGIAADTKRLAEALVSNRLAASACRTADESRSLSVSVTIFFDSYGKRLRGDRNDKPKVNRTDKGDEHADALPKSSRRRNVAVSNRCCCD